MNRTKLAIAVLVAFLAGFVVGVQVVEGTRPQSPAPLPVAFTSFIGPAQSPPGRAAAWAGTPSYATPTPVVVAAAPAPSPEASRSSRQRRNPTAAQRERVPAARHTRHQLSGKASWHATGRSGLYAAACKPLRAAIGPGWRGSQVLVASGRRAVEVTLNDWCGSRDKTIDLSDEAFGFFAPLSRGVVRVTVGW